MPLEFTAFQNHLVLQEGHLMEIHVTTKTTKPTNEPIIDIKAVVCEVSGLIVERI